MIRSKTKPIPVNKAIQNKNSVKAKTTNHSQTIVKLKSKETLQSPEHRIQQPLNAAFNFNPAMVTASTTHGAHILVIPFPGSGHIIPLLDLSRQFLTRGLTITVLVRPTNLPLLEPLLSAHPSSLHSLVLSFPYPLDGLISKIRAMAQLRDPINQWFKSHPSPPVAIISDFFLGWTQHLASDLGLPRLMFSPSGAFALSLMDSMWRRPEEDENLLEGDSDWAFFRKNMMANIASWALIFNTFAELERVHIDYFKKEVGHDRVWAVGPLLAPNDDSVESTEHGGSSSVPTHEVLTWLDQWPDHSVVYVCFGSRTVLTHNQMKVLSAALEDSGVTFIWGVNGTGEGHVAGDYGVIPDGFEDRVGERGFLIKGWAPQVGILRHRAVGVFLTHCGWNSLLEGLSAGVMMLTWPMGADQYSNTELLVDQLGVGVRVGEGTQNVLNSAKLTRLLVESVSGTRPERQRAMELSGAAMVAVKGGSSKRDLDELVKRFTELKTGSGSGGGIVGSK